MSEKNNEWKRKYYQTYTELMDKYGVTDRLSKEQFYAKMPSGGDFTDAWNKVISEALTPIYNQYSGKLYQQGQSSEYNPYAGAKTANDLMDALDQVKSKVEYYTTNPKEETSVEVTPGYQALMDQYYNEANKSAEFNPEIASQWLPYLKQISDPLLAQENASMKEDMNSLGRYVSGQTVQNSANNVNKYNTANLEKALGYSYDDYNNQLNNINTAKTNYLGMIDKVNDRGWNLTDAEKSRLQQLTDKTTQRQWDLSDFDKSSQLAKELTSKSGSSNEDDWLKYIQAAAGVAKTVA